MGNSGGLVKGYFMCGIYAGNITVEECLGSLKRLLHRGADSYGVASFNSKGELVRHVELGHNIPDTIEGFDDCPYILGHNRWASTSQPNLEGCHPVVSFDEKIILVHNGTVSYSEEMSENLSRHTGVYYAFKSDTQFLVDYISFLLHKEYSLTSDIKGEIDHVMTGTYAICYMLKSTPNYIFFAVKDSPLYYYEGKFSSEASVFPKSFAIPNNSYGYIAEWGKASGNPHNSDMIKLRLNRTIIEPKYVDNTCFTEKNGGAKTEESYMLQEIKEQSVLSYDYGQFAEIFNVDNKSEGLEIVACGSSYNAALYGKKALETADSFIKVNVVYASECVVRPYSQPYGYKLAITQSGESADIIEVLRELDKYDESRYIITNHDNSTATQYIRYSENIFPMSVGEEKAVAATKSFTATCMLLLSLFDNDQYRKIDLAYFREAIADCINLLPTIQYLASVINNFKNYMVFGSGLHYPIAIETALKLTETARINCQGLPFEQYKHGSIAICDQDFLALSYFPHQNDLKFERILNTVKQVKARRGFVLGIGCSKVKECDWFIETVRVEPVLQPLVDNVVGQLLAYSLGKYRGYDVDNCRSCAKAITVH